MCELCNGTHVIKSTDGAFYGFYPCTNCGPISNMEFKQKRTEMKIKIDEALHEIMKKGA